MGTMRINVYTKSWLIWKFSLTNCVVFLFIYLINKSFLFFRENLLVQLYDAGSSMVFNDRCQTLLWNIWVDEGVLTIMHFGSLWLLLLDVLNFRNSDINWIELIIFINNFQFVIIIIFTGSLSIFLLLFLLYHL